MARVRACESFAGLLACMGAGQEAEFDDETASAMIAEGYPVEIAVGPAPGGPLPDRDRDAGADGGEGDGDDGGDGDIEAAGA